MSEIFAKKDPDVIKSEVFGRVRDTTGRAMSAASPQGLHTMGIIDTLIHQRALIDWAGKMALIRHADAIGLEGIGDWMRAPRHSSGPSFLQVQVTTTTDHTAQVLPAGTEVTGGNLVFALDEDLICYPAGSYIGIATCTTGGADTNAVPIGEIDRLVDPAANLWFSLYSATITNISTSSGGRDIESVEDYRARLMTSAPALAVAGPRGAYKAIGEASHAGIKQVEAFNAQDFDDGRITGPVGPDPALVPGDVWVIVLQRSDSPFGIVTDAPPRDAVEAALSSDDARPLTDHVRVRDPHENAFHVDIEYWIAASRSSEALAIQAAVDEAVMHYIWWQVDGLGRDIVPSKLIEYVMAAGAKRVDVTSPAAHVIIAMDTASWHDGGVLITYGGIEDD